MSKFIKYDFHSIETELLSFVYFYEFNILLFLFGFFFVHILRIVEMIPFYESLQMDENKNLFHAAGKKKRELSFDAICCLA